jgi:hypothetical protein
VCLIATFLSVIFERQLPKVRLLGVFALNFHRLQGGLHAGAEARVGPEEFGLAG